MQNKVQLKEEELVNSELTLTDIYPKTDTMSITDDASGQSLDVVLEHLWESINNQLARYVNSVNGRTGVLTLDASDVGLSNVDNVSYEEIQNWVIDRTEAEFYGHLLRIFDTLEEAQRLVIEPNDRAYENTPFFARHGIDSESLDQYDYRSYIGYFRYNADESKMEMKYKIINVVGKTDRSLTYSQNEVDGGTLKVHIHPDETVLYLDNGISDTVSGLRIDQSRLGGKTYVFFGAYYSGSINDYIMPHGTNGFPDDSNSGWYSGFLMPASASSDTQVRIYINERDYGLHYITDIISIPKFRDGDTILCYFNPYIRKSDHQLEDSTRFKHEFMFRQPAIGRVSYDGNAYTIRFKSLVPYTTWGITNKETHLNLTNGKYDDTELSLDFANTQNGDSASPINVMSNVGQYQFDLDPQYGQPTDGMSYIVTPSGHEKLFTESETRKGGVFLQTDYSLCVMPYSKYGSSDMKSSELINNWSIITPDTVTAPSARGHRGFLNTPTYLGINLFKGITNAIGGKKNYVPLSGLTLFNHSDSGTVTPSRERFMQQFGMDPEVDDLIFDPTDPEAFNWSGGLMVNVGKYLEIRSTNVPQDGTQMANQGKVNVRIGDGLKNDGHNRITINCGESVYISDEGKLEAMGGGGGGLNALKIDDSEGGSIFYNPSASSSQEEPKSVTYVHLGPGLYITTTELDDTDTSSGS